MNIFFDTYWLMMFPDFYHMSATLVYMLRDMFSNLTLWPRLYHWKRRRYCPLGKWALTFRRKLQPPIAGFRVIVILIASQLRNRRFRRAKGGLLPIGGLSTYLSVLFISAIHIVTACSNHENMEPEKPV